MHDVALVVKHDIAAVAVLGLIRHIPANSNSSSGGLLLQLCFVLKAVVSGVPSMARAGSSMASTTSSCRSSPAVGSLPLHELPRHTEVLPKILYGYH
jgi:hypothetical protein